MSAFIEFFLSGWTFFFRFPVARVKTFWPASIFLGPVLQTLVFSAIAWPIAALVPQAPSRLDTFAGMVGLALMTGLFHEDGFADTADSLGVSKFDASEKTLDRIHAAMKDSRVGSFGATAISLLWIERALVCFAWHFTWTAMAWAIFASRSLAFAMAYVLGRMEQPGQARRSGHLMHRIGKGSFVTFVACSIFIVAGAWLPFELSALDVRLVMLLPTAFFGMLFLWAVTRRSEGLSGDLIGACVCFCEIVYCLFCVVFAKNP